jgi:multicomponent K+:H+ antiporter subunit D
LLLDAAAATPAHAWIWSVVLLSSLVMVVALSRCASAVFWGPSTVQVAPPPAAQGTATGGHGLLLAALLLLGCGLLMALFADPTYEYLRQTASALVAA